MCSLPVFPILSNENATEGDMLLPQPQLFLIAFDFTIKPKVFFQQRLCLRKDWLHTQGLQALNTRVNMSFVTLLSLCNLTASGSPLILIVYGKFNSRSYAGFLFSPLSDENKMEGKIQLHFIAFFKFTAIKLPFIFAFLFVQSQCES